MKNKAIVEYLEKLDFGKIKSKNDINKAIDILSRGNPLPKKKIHQIGIGAYSKVYGTNGSKVVIKITFNEDSAAGKFLRYVEKNPSKYFPKIYKFQQSRKYPGLFIAWIERLTLDDKTAMKICKFIDIIEGIHGYGKTDPQKKLNLYLNQYNIAQKKYKPNSKVIKSIKDEITYWRQAIKQMNKATLLLGPELIEVIIKLLNWGRKHELYSDFHSRNIMFRGKTPVIIDPVTN